MIKISTPKLILIALIALLLTTLSSVWIQQQVSAQTSEEATEAAEETEETVTNNIRELILETTSQIRGTTDDQKRAIIGEVQRITDEALTIQHLEGQQIVPLADSLLLQSDETLSETINVEDIAVGNWVTIMGTVEEQSVSPDFILVSSESLKTDPQIVLLGTITDLTSSTITIRPRDGSGEREVELATTTELQNSQGEPATLSEFEVDMTVLVTGFSSEDEATASTIRSLAPLKAATNQ